MEPLVYGSEHQRRSEGLLATLGWEHRGFRASPRAPLWLAAILALPAAIDLGATLTAARRYPDLELWRTTAADFLKHPDQALYERHSEYLYAPFFLTFIWPLTRMPELAAHVVFELAKWVALFGTLRIAWRLASPPGEDVPPVVALGTLLLTGRFIANDLLHSNINAFLLLAISPGCIWRPADTSTGPAF